MDVEKLLKEYEALDHDDQTIFMDKVRWNNSQKAQKHVEDRVRELEKKYVGRCYKWEQGRGQGEVTTIYCKILNFRHEGDYWRPEAIVFPEKPRFHFEKALHMMHETGDNFLGSTDFEGINVEPVWLFRVPFDKEEVSDRMEEISEEEFDDAMRNFTEELIKDGGARSVPTSGLD